MTPSTEALVGDRLLLRRTSSAGTPPLEMFVRLRNHEGTHFYLRGLSLADFADLFEHEIRALTVLVYRMPPSLLNPAYWEPLTREGEHAVREKLTGIVTRYDGEQTLLWRADRVSAGRWLRDGLDLRVELVHGYIFRVSGADLLKLAAVWSGGRERIEWIGFSALPEGEAGAAAALAAHNDLTGFRLSRPEERIAYASLDNDSTRVIFADRALARRAAASAVRGYVYNITRATLAPINERVADQFLRVADGLGWLSRPDQDFVDKQRAYEFAAHFGKTQWGLHSLPGQEVRLDNDRALIYYDRTSGIWAVAT